MQLTEENTLVRIRHVKHQLSELRPGNLDALIPIGAELESILSLIAADREGAKMALVACLEAMEVIFEGNISDFNRLMPVITATVAALEHYPGPHDNPVAKGRLTQIVSTFAVENKNGGPPLRSSDAETPPVVLSTLRSIAAHLIQLEPDDHKGFRLVSYSLLRLAAIEDSDEIRKLLVNAGREIDLIITGKTDDTLNTIDTAMRLIDRTIEISKSDLSVIELIMAPETIPDTSYHSDILPDDLDLDLAAEFIIESREMLEIAEACLLELEIDPENTESINTIFRAFHTIKGTAAYLGLHRLASFAHLAESLLSRMRDREIRCTGGYANLALRSIDTIKQMLRYLQERLNGDESKFPDDYDELIGILSDPEAAHVSDRLTTIAKIFAGKERDLADDTSDQIYESTRLGDALIEMGKVTKDQMAEAIASKGSMLLGVFLVKRGYATPNDIDHALEIQKQLRSAKNPLAGGSTVRVRTERLDRLIDIVGELAIAQSMLIEDDSLGRGAYTELGRKISHSGTLVRELQELIIGMRLVPLQSTFQRMVRVVRDVSQKCGKQVKFITEGDETEIDRNMVDMIADPLLHMVRNAVDHGIETPDVRRRSGKTATGTIRLAAYRSGRDVVVELHDDGAGIDLDIVVARALAKNLIETDKGLSHKQIYDLLLAPGFSTAEEVTVMSGRGVGMDVVRRNIEEMGGSIAITSQKGHGSLFTIRLPLTLAITDGTLTRVGAERFMVPVVKAQVSM